MIVDNIKNASVYFGINSAIEEALRFLMNYAGQTDKSASIHVSDRVTVKVCPYTTKDESECVFEAHKRYADIHYMISGGECMAYTHIDNLRVMSENEKDDLILLDGSGTKIPLNKGDFLIAFPQDAHMCAIKQSVPAPCCKLVAKILL